MNWLQAVVLLTVGWSGCWAVMRLARRHAIRSGEETRRRFEEARIAAADESVDRHVIQVMQRTLFHS